MKKNALEWTVFAVSLALIVATLGVLFRDCRQDRQRPPRFSVQTGEPERSGNGWRVPFTVRNDGDTTAEMVEVDAEAEDQEARATLDYVPRGSERTGGFVFRKRPDKVTAKVAGYQDP